MVQIKKDKFVLGQSAPTQLDPNNKKIKMNIQLQLASSGGAIAASVSGNVIDSSNANVSGALVSVMDANYEPLINAVTDASGNYAFAALPASSSYTIFAIAAGKQLNQGSNFTIASGSTVIRNFTLANEASAQLGVIVGDVIKTGTTTPVAGGVVTLHSSAVGEALVAVAYTNDFGQYAFREVPIGNYFIQMNALGYVSKRVQTVNIATAGQILNQDITLDADTNAAKGTISGVITDNDSNPIPRADCVLYSVAADGSLTAVAYSKANPNGVYLFTNVAQGNYRVKSNFMDSVDYTLGGEPRPSVDSLTLTEASTTVPVSTFARLGTLANGAYTKAAGQPSEGFVVLLGGSTGGSATLTVYVPRAGEYTLGVQHLNTAIMNMLLDINGVNTGQTYAMPTTPTWNNVDARVDNIAITLVSGNNTIKIYGNAAGNAPAIGALTFTKKADTVTKLMADFALASGAVANTTSGFINNIGGSNAGTATTTVAAPVAGDYSAVVSYYGNTARPMRVDINGTYTGTEYNFPLSTATNPAATFTIPLTLASGNNTIKFYNASTTVFAPDIQKVVYTQAQYNNLQEAETATLEGSATAANGFVSGLGGSGSGSVTITKTVPFAGAYDLIVTYVTVTVGAKLRLVVNGVDSGGLISLDTTATMNAADKKTVTVRVNLNAGSNTIKIM